MKNKKNKTDNFFDKKDKKNEKKSNFLNVKDLNEIVIETRDTKNFFEDGISIDFKK